ncbi:hypothetical protein GOODEAATRI_028822 [Goodea atripinnis]|uniref:Uncharacterized protein n=1 Tax=Goodea atripinnis TaxID=208336 RepID=A0ABV0NHS7_9TELE
MASVLLLGRRKMLHPQRSLSELPKMSAASQVERAVLVSASNRETHRDSLLKQTASRLILTHPKCCCGTSCRPVLGLNVCEARGEQELALSPRPIRRPAR